MDDDYFPIVALLVFVAIVGFSFFFGVIEGNKKAHMAIKACEAELPRDSHCKIIAVEDK